MSLNALGRDWLPYLERVLGPLSLPADCAAFERCWRYLDLAVTWNARINLTAARTPEELADLYFADAVLLASGADGRWVDVGTGGGPPGLSLAVLRPELELTLVEPRAKRVSFLRQVVVALDLERVTVRRGRSEELEDAGFDTAVSRATFEPAEWLPEGARLATRVVWVLLARGVAPAHDGWQVDVDQRYDWPLTGARRRAVRYVPAGG